MTGCTFSGNSARYRAGAIYLSFYSILTVEDCVFTGNFAENDSGGAIYGLYTDNTSYSDATFPGATIRISGNLEIDGESFSANKNNLFLGKNGIVIEVTGPLTNTKPIPVSVEDNPSGTNVRVITDGLAENGTYKNFVSVNDSYTVVPTDDGEAAIAVKSRVHTVTVDENTEYGSVAVNKEQAVEGDTVTLTVTPQAYYEVTVLTVKTASGEEVAVTDNQFTMPGEDVSVTAAFAPIEYSISIRGGGGTVTVDKETAVAGEKVTITIEIDDDRYFDPREKKVRIKDKSEYVPLTEVDETTYYFIMPGDDIDCLLQFYPYPRYEIQINGKYLTSKYTSDEGWSYDGDAGGGTLTLNNANITLGQANNANIYIGIPVTIVLEGENKLSGQQMGISAMSPITITGDGKLSAEGQQFGIQAQQGLIISGNADITASGGTIGIQVDNSQPLSITGSTVYASGGSAVGIYAFHSEVTISGSEVTAVGTNNAIGISAAALNISDNSTVTFTGQNLGAQCTSIEITDSNVTATGTQDIGLYATASITIHSGTTDATGAKGALLADGSITLDEGMNVKTPALGRVSDDGKSIVEEDGTTKATYVVITETAPEFTTHQLILSGQIGMHFYMIIPEGMTGGDMTFTVGSRTAAAAGVLQKDGRYMFTCYVNSVEMAETITATYSYTADGGMKTVTDTTSVKEYLEKVIDNEDGKTEYTAAAPLAMAIYNYGHYAMEALPGGSKHPKMPATYTGELPLIESLEGCEISTKLDNSVITAASYSLDLDSETAINFYLTTKSELTEEDVSVTAYADFDFTVEKVGSRCRVRITGIGAHELGTVFTMETGNTTIEASAMTYVQQCLANADAGDETKHAAAALYEYYRQAISYKN